MTHRLLGRCSTTELGTKAAHLFGSSQSNTKALESINPDKQDKLELGPSHI